MVLTTVYTADRANPSIGNSEKKINNKTATHISS